MKFVIIILIINLINGYNLKGNKNLKIENNLKIDYNQVKLTKQNNIFIVNGLIECENDYKILYCGFNSINFEINSHFTIFGGNETFNSFCCINNNENMINYKCLNQLYDKENEKTKSKLNLNKLKIKEDENNWNINGKILYEWDNCEKESKEYKLFCEFFNISKPNKDDFQELNSIIINCDGNEININSTDKNYNVFGCLLNNSTDYEINTIRGYIVTNTQYVIIGVICGGTLLYVIVSIIFMYRVCMNRNKKDIEESLLDNQQ